jgi:hypothetical protein
MFRSLEASVPFSRAYKTLLHTLLFVSGVLAASCGASAWGDTLESREYKLALSPNKFSGADPGGRVAELWDQVIKPAIDRLDPDDDGDARDKHEFGGSKSRRVTFKDTPHCALKAAGFALRERVKLKKSGEDGKAKLTLKFRSPDAFIAASAKFAGSDSDEDDKFEEDVVPWTGPDGARSIRSLYSRSGTQILSGVAPTSLRALIPLYDGLENEFAKVGISGDVLTEPLVDGQAIRELVIRDAKVDLGKKTDAEFSVTLWHAGDQPASAPPIAAELSYRYGTQEGDVPGPVARRALRLFQELHARLGEWGSAEHETKTALGLPKCP